MKEGPKIELGSGLAGLAGLDIPSDVKPRSVEFLVEEMRLRDAFWEPVTRVSP